MENNKLKEFLSPKSDGMIRATISKRLDEIFFGYPKISIAQHIKAIFRPLEEIQGDSFNWKDEKTLGKIERYQKELLLSYDKEQLSFEDEPLDEEFVEEGKNRYPDVYQG